MTCKKWRIIQAHSRISLSDLPIVVPHWVPEPWFRMLSGLGLGTWLHFVSLDFRHIMSLWVNHVKERSPPWTPRRGKGFKMLVLSTLFHVLNVLSVTWELDAETTGGKQHIGAPKQSISLRASLWYDLSLKDLMITLNVPAADFLGTSQISVCSALMGVSCIKGRLGLWQCRGKLESYIIFIKDNYLRFEVKTKTELFLNLKVKKKLA